MLLKEGCSIDAYDPAAMGRTAEALPASECMHYVEDSYAAARGKDALLILTDWQEFAELDLDRLSESMRYPIVIDGRNLYEPAAMAERGFTYLSVGRPNVNQLREATVPQWLL